MKKIILSLFLISSISAFAQKSLEMKSTTEGLSVGLSGNYLGWSSQYFSVLDQQEPSGAGLGLQVGYGINERIEVLARYDLSSLALVNEWDFFNFNNLSGVLRFNFGSTTGRFRPFLEAGVSQSQLKMSPIQFGNDIVEYQLKGIGLTYGGGFNVFLMRNLSLELAASGVSGKFNSFLIDGIEANDGKPDAANFRIKAGIRFAFKNL